MLLLFVAFVVALNTTRLDPPPPLLNSILLDSSRSLGVVDALLSVASRPDEDDEDESDILAANSDGGDMLDEEKIVFY